LKKEYFSSHKLPKQQSTNLWSQGILGVNERNNERWEDETYAKKQFGRLLVDEYCTLFI
jgi:hypothetical protein